MPSFKRSFFFFSARGGARKGSIYQFEVLFEGLGTILKSGTNSPRAEHREPRSLMQFGEHSRFARVWKNIS